jgi:antitoxin component of RelBE/YafQ-DinJ toxin-antitoxin module
MQGVVMPRAPSRTYRLDHETLELMAQLAQKLGVAQTDVIRMAVRRMAAAERVRRPEPTERQPDAE